MLFHTILRFTCVYKTLTPIHVLCVGFRCMYSDTRVSSPATDTTTLRIGYSLPTSNSQANRSFPNYSISCSLSSMMQYIYIYTSS